MKSLTEQFIRSAKQHWHRFCMADSTGIELTYGQVLVRVLLIKSKLSFITQQNVAVLLPTSSGSAIVNIALLMLGKSVVNINFTLGEEHIINIYKQCNIDIVITSRTFLQKINISHDRSAIYLEDLAQQISFKEKIYTFLWAYLASVDRLLRAIVCPPELATIIFSSGSTGQPKGVMLSHNNILSNIEGCLKVLPVTKTDRVLGILPFFHSFGYTVTFWLPLLRGMGVIYHPNPLEGKIIGKLIEKYKIDILLGAPTFLHNYTKVCSREQFSSVRYAITGAEKLQPSIAKNFKTHFGIDLYEGYGCTELSPVVSFNMPGVTNQPQTYCHGTVGKPLPNLEVKIVDPKTLEPLSFDKEGVLIVKGPSVMQGYWRNPSLTEEVMHKDWYITGDLAVIDRNGFLKVVDRIMRFSKIGGEMVPHLRIEEEITKLLGAPSCAVTAVANTNKGEALVVLFTHQKLTGEDIWQCLQKTNLPKLWLPKKQSIYKVDALPLLATGKLDWQGIKETALKKIAGAPC